MSEELQKIIDELKEENKRLLQQALANSQGVEQILSQLDAHKAMLNDSLTSTLHLKAQVILFEKHIKRLNEAAVESQSIIEGLKNKLTEAEAKIANFENNVQ
jgi:chromosome segregation ATPase